MSPKNVHPRIVTIARDGNIANTLPTRAGVEIPSSDNIMLHSINWRPNSRCWELKTSAFPACKDKALPAVPVVSTAHLFSDCIIFLCSSMETAVSMYLAWINECGEVSARQTTRPTAHIVILDHAKPLTTHDFVWHCSKESAAGSRDEREIRECCFAGLKVVITASAELIRITENSVEGICVDWDEIKQVVKSGARRRENLGRLWTQEALFKLHHFWCRTGKVPDAVSLLTAKFASSELAIACAGNRQVLGTDERSEHVTEASRRLSWCLNPDDDTGMLTEHIIPVIAGILARHSLHSEYWAVPPKEMALTGTYIHFAQEHFEYQYGDILDTLFASFEHRLELAEIDRLTIQDSKVYDPDDRWLRITQTNEPRQGALRKDLVRLTMQNWIKLVRCFGEQHSTFDVARKHIQELQQHRSFGQDRKEGYFCSVCVCAPWDTLLQCEHGLCRLCLMASFEQEQGSSHVLIDRCPVCLKEPPIPYTINPIPPTAAVRVLALDGGGVRGIVQLEILHLLEQRIGLDVPFTSFFDLMVGTSIGKHEFEIRCFYGKYKEHSLTSYAGGICAIGLGRCGWSIEECKEKFLALTRQAFPSMSKPEEYLSWATGGWYKTIRDVTKILIKDSLYDTAQIESILKEAFGSASVMAAPQTDSNTCRVAVVANEASKETCAILPTYNIVKEGREERYTWPREYRKCHIWEA